MTIENWQSIKLELETRAAGDTESHLESKFARASFRLAFSFECINMQAARKLRWMRERGVCSRSLFPKSMVRSIDSSVREESYSFVYYDEGDELSAVQSGLALAMLCLCLLFFHVSFFHPRFPLVRESFPSLSPLTRLTPSPLETSGPGDL